MVADDEYRNRNLHKLCAFLGFIIWFIPVVLITSVTLSLFI